MEKVVEEVMELAEKDKIMFITEILNKLFGGKKMAKKKGNKKDQWTELLEKEVKEIEPLIKKIKADKDITAKDIMEYLHEAVDIAVKITEATSKIIPNWNKDKKEWAVKLIDDAIDLGDIYPVLKTIDITNVDRIFIGYLVDQAVKTLNSAVGKNWDKVDKYTKYIEMINNIIGELGNN